MNNVKFQANIQKMMYNPNHNETVLVDNTHWPDFKSRQKKDDGQTNENLYKGAT